MLKRGLYSLLPTPIRIQGRTFFQNYWLDLRDRVLGTVDREIPPRHLNISGDGPFRAYGENTVALCRELAGLQPNNSVLDIGCGIGRTALALSKFLSSDGRYLGFDIIEFAIQWCRRHISVQHSNFRFVHADVFNHFYNPRGSTAPEQYAFPCSTGEFSFALATSLFTHVLPATAANYVREMSRSLTPRGRCVSTWFLLDEVSESQIQTGDPKFSFPHRFEAHAQLSLDAPELAVAYPRGRVERMFDEAALRITGLYRGNWSGSVEPAHSMQDLIVAERQ